MNVDTADGGQTTHSSSTPYHPIIDVAPIINANDTGRDDVVSAIGKALRTRGYFYAQNVQTLPRDYIDSVYEYSRRIHALPIDIKRQYSQRGGHGAYSGRDVGQVSVRVRVITSVREAGMAPILIGM